MISALTDRDFFSCLHPGFAPKKCLKWAIRAADNRDLQQKIHGVKIDI
jgi:hypothetical protein